MRNKVFKVLCVCVLLFQYSVNAQKPTLKIINNTKAIQSTHSLNALAVYRGDSVIIRWAANDGAVWDAGKTVGYIVKRYTIDSVQKKLTNEKILTPTPIKPWTIAVFKTAFQQSRDTALAAAAEVLYNTEVVLKGTSVINPQNILEKSGQQKDLTLFGQLVASLSPKCATAMGLRFVDNTVEKNKEYFYQVFPSVADKMLTGDTGITVISTAKKGNEYVMPTIMAKPKDRLAEFSWDNQMADFLFVAYSIERSDDGGKTFKATHKLPLMAGLIPIGESSNQGLRIFNDSLPMNYKSYLFRIKGINAFGEYSVPSNVVSVSGVYRTPPQRAQIVETTNFKDNMVKIIWKSSQPVTNIAGYLVGRAQDYQGPFVPLGINLLNDPSNTFIDSTADAGGNNYYIVTTFDTAGNFSNSTPAHVVITDTTAPDAPMVVSNTIDSLGHIMLTWKAPKAKDVQGYMVQRANALNHTFVSVTDGFITDTTFSDSISLNTLTKHIYYRVMAYDRVRNLSKPSNVADILKPDIVPPVPAVFINYITSDTSIQLFWNPSSSNDLSKQYLQKKSEKGQWEQVAVLNKDQSIYLDTNIAKKTLYSYQIISQDSAGLMSEPSFPITAQTYYKENQEDIGNLLATPNADSTAINISWLLSKSSKASAIRILLYRSVNNSPFILFENIDANKTDYSDTQIVKGNCYGYRFKCQYNDNKQSFISSRSIVCTSQNMK